MGVISKIVVYYDNILQNYSYNMLLAISTSPAQRNPKRAGATGVASTGVEQQSAAHTAGGNWVPGRT